MKYSQQDVIAHLNLLEQLFGTQENDCLTFDSHIVQQCIQRFANTFSDDSTPSSDADSSEICPTCRIGSLKKHYLSYYKINIQRCDICSYNKRLDV